MSLSLLSWTAIWFDVGADALQRLVARPCWRCRRWPRGRPSWPGRSARAGPVTLKSLGACAVGQRTGRLVALRLERAAPARSPAWSSWSAAACDPAAACRPGVVDAESAQRGRGDDRQGEQGDQTRADAPVAQGYSRARCPSGPSASAGPSAASPPGAAAPGRAARSPLSPGAAGPWFWVCWGEEPRSVPPRGSCSAAALPSLLKRPCTSVATSGPGVPPLERRDGVGVVGRRTRPMVVVSDRRCSPFPAATRRCVAPPARRPETRGGAWNSSTVPDLQQGPCTGL